MEPLFAVRMTHDEDMYYNQVLASKQSAPAEKPGKKNFLSRVDLSDVIFGLLAFFVFYMTFPAEELAQRIVQSALMAGVFVLVLGQLNGNRRREKQRIAPDADERNQGYPFTRIHSSWKILGSPPATGTRAYRGSRRQSSII
ncbi:MAG: hypothetical protein E7B18_04980 [Clostridium sp.]|nr:hypothetical protein [Clostridium sp.]